ncbi:MAG: ribonuclease [Patescibacteria group bacterium]|nr:ribonuclease [Patescibacteria group bacterium]
MAKKAFRFDRDEFERKVAETLAGFGIDASPSAFVPAFIHRSVLNEYDFPESNERLEFLGDAVLELVATEFLYRRFADKAEGDMTDIRSALVRGKNLAQASERVGFGNLVLLSRGETLAGGDKNPYILANTFEAFLGALYLDSGLEAVRAFVTEHVLSGVDDILEADLHVDPKSRLQEIAQAVYGSPPEYELLAESGADHDKTYEIAVKVGRKIVGKGVGTSKKKAQSNAAEDALARESEWNSRTNGGVS